MAKSARARAFEAEHGAPPKPLGRFSVVVPSSSDKLFDYVDTTEPQFLQAPDIEPQTAEPEIRIEGTKIGTRGGNLASTALQNIMDSFNAASRKKGVDTIGDAVVDDRFSTHYGGRQHSLPHIVGEFMDGKARPASLREKDPLDPSKSPKHDKDLDVLNNTELKRAEGWDEEIIAAEKAEIRDWLLANYGAGAIQKVAYPYGPALEHKVTHVDREKLVSRIRRLEKEAKRIASGEVEWFFPVPPNDEEPLSQEELEMHEEKEVI